MKSTSTPIINSRMSKRKTPAWFAEFEQHQKRKTTKTKFQTNNTTTLSIIPETERQFIWGWCQSRNLDDIFAVVALTYWVRARAHLVVNFLLHPDSKTLYMVLCIHAALKWLGYDEQHKCDFFTDLVGVRKDMKPGVHQRMEMDLLTTLNWEL